MKYTVGQVLERIQKGEKMNQIVSEFGLLKKHFQEQLKEIGYRGDRAGRYHWDHNEPEPLDFDLLDKYIKRVSKFKEGLSEETREASVEIAPSVETPDPIIEEVIHEDEHPASASLAIASEIKIEFVEDKKKEKSKIFKGFYLEPEVAEVLNKISNKSDVVNSTMKAFFKSQGLL